MSDIVDVMLAVASFVAVYAIAYGHGYQQARRHYKYHVLSTGEPIGGRAA